MSISRFKLVFFCPRPSTSRVLNHLFTKYPEALGKIGDYEQCAFVTPGIGQISHGLPTTTMFKFMQDNLNPGLQLSPLLVQLENWSTWRKTELSWSLMTEGRMRKSRTRSMSSNQ
jgi:hypothetical protein